MSWTDSSLPSRGASPTARPTGSTWRRMTLALVDPPVALSLDVVARILPEMGRAYHDDLETIRPRLVPAPCTGRHAHHVPLFELDELVVELHPPGPTDDHIDLLLLLMRVAVRKAITGRDALVAQTGLLELERLGRHAELQVGRAVEVGPDVLQILLEVPDRERHLWPPTQARPRSARARSARPSLPLRRRWRSA